MSHAGNDKNPVHIINTRVEIFLGKWTWICALCALFNEWLIDCNFENASEIQNKSTVYT